MAGVLSPQEPTPVAARLKGALVPIPCPLCHILLGSALTLWPSPHSCLCPEHVPRPRAESGPTSDPFHPLKASSGPDSPDCPGKEGPL